MKKTVKFVAHEVVKLPTEVEFTTSDGKDVDFIARKKTRIPIRVQFKAQVK